MVRVGHGGSGDAMKIPPIEKNNVGTHFFLFWPPDSISGTTGFRILPRKQPEYFQNILFQEK